MEGGGEEEKEGDGACRRYHRRECPYIQGARGPAGPISLLPIYSSSFFLFFVCEMILLIFCFVTIW